MAVNNEPRLNVEEQQDDTTFKATSDIDDSDHLKVKKSQLH